jgi:excisionase family DNA binding protein
MENQQIFEAILRDFLTPIIEQAVENALSHQLTLPSVSRQSVPEILDCDGAARFLGLSKGRVYKMTSGKEVPYYTTGKRVYFKRDELVEWVTRHRIKPHSEIEQEATSYVTLNRRKH